MIDGSGIVQNSNAMFGIINESQVKETDFAEKAAILSIAEKVDADLAAVTGLGSAVDIRA